MNIKKNVGQRIRELRKKRNFSQEKLAEMIDIAQNTLSYIENGENFFTAETLEKVVLALDIEPQELFSFGHQESKKELLNEINRILEKNPDKIQEVYKITRAIVN
jgi:transcriptional regulator with XRE-family HTH domain